MLSCNAVRASGQQRELITKSLPSRRNNSTRHCRTSYCADWLNSNWHCSHCSCLLMVVDCTHYEILKIWSVQCSSSKATHVTSKLLHGEMPFIAVSNLFFNQILVYLHGTYDSLWHIFHEPLTIHYLYILISIWHHLNLIKHRLCLRNQF